MEMFKDFIDISYQEQEPRTIFSNYIFEKLNTGASILDDKQVKSIEESSIHLYKESLEFVFPNESLKLCEGNSELSEAITDNFLEFVSDTQKKIASSENHFHEEEKMLIDFKTITKPSFQQKWEPVKNFIEKSYNTREINVEFYNKEFSESFNQDVKNEKDDLNADPVNQSSSFEIIKKNFEKKWDKELYQKKIKHELHLIEMARMEFLKDLYENIEKFKKMMGGMIDDDDMNNILGRLWGMGKGKWEKVNFDAIRKYSERLKNDPSLKELAEMLGRMHNGETELVDEEFVNTKKRREWIPEIATKSDLIGIKESDDLSSVLFSEIALLSDKSLENIFIKKFTDKKLQTFEYEGRTKIYVNEEFLNFRQKEIESEKGPFILCIDTSGSMNGTPEEVAKSLALAMTNIAIRDNRKCFMITFSEAIETLNLTDPKTALVELIPFLSHSFHGGTDVEPAIEEALRMLKNKDYKKADVIMISDFVVDSIDSGLSLAIKAAQKNKTKFHSIVIGKSHNEKFISVFDTNWIYNTNNTNVITLLKNKI